MRVVQSSPVEFRLLQVLGSVVGNERRTVALVHWDGKQLRFAWNRLDVPESTDRDPNDVRRVISGVRLEVERVSDSQLLLNVDSLQSLLKVPEGDLGALSWTPIHVGYTIDPQAHFAELVSDLRLTVPGESTARKAPRLGPESQLMALGEQILSEVGHAARALVHIHEGVVDLSKYTSPLSWKNGKWHHSVPISMGRAPVDRVGNKFQHALGVIAAAIPTDEVGVIVVFYPADKPEVAERLASAEDFVRDKFPDRVDCERVPLSEPNRPELGKLKERIKRDIGARA